MSLYKYDEKLVQITDDQNIVYEGICSHNSKDYTMHEYGVNEESLDILNILFYKSNIKKISFIDKFTEPYGEIEKMIVEDGIDMIEQVFDSGCDEHIYRVLLCLEQGSISDEIKTYLKRLIDDTSNKKIIKKAKELYMRKEL